MVKIVENKDRIRNETYSRINKLMYPQFWLELVGATSNILTYSGCNLGKLFLHWDNNNITITGDPRLFISIAEKLEKHGFNVTIEV